MLLVFNPNVIRNKAGPVIVIFIFLQSCIDGVGASCVGIICNITDISRTARVSIQAIPDNRQFFVSKILQRTSIAT